MGIYQCEVRLLIEAITKKFTKKDKIQKFSREKITQTPKSQYSQISLLHNRDYSQKRIQTLLAGTWQRLVFIFLSSIVASFLFLSCFGSSETKKKRVGALFCPFLSLAMSLGNQQEQRCGTVPLWSHQQQPTILCAALLIYITLDQKACI